MRKRGISAVIATVLIILITVTTVTILWVIVIPMVTDSLVFSSLEGRVTIVTSGGYTFYDASRGIASVQVKRGMDDGVIGGVKVIFSFGGDSVSSSVAAPEPGNTVVYVFDVGGRGAPDSVAVAPIFVVGDREKEGGVSSEVSIREGTAADVGFVYELGRDYEFSTAGFSGLVSWWRLEGDANDAVGDNDGALIGDVDCSVVGRYGNGCSFDGDADWIEIPDDDSLDVINEITISMWLYQLEESLAGGNAITKDATYKLGPENQATDPLYPSYQMRVQTAVGGWGSYLSSNSATTLNQWVHIVGTYDSSTNTSRIYINGNLDAQSTTGITGPLESNTENLFIGRGGSWVPYFKGIIDEPMIFNRALSENEVRGLYELDLS